MTPEDPEQFCKSSIDRMLKNSQTKVIFPVITLALLQEFVASGKTVFTDSEIKRLYENTVHELTDFLGHDVHIGGKYYDAYPSRNLPRYQVLKTVASMTYELLDPYLQCAPGLCDWIRERVKSHIAGKLGFVPQFHDAKARLEFANSQAGFLDLLTQQINKTPANFEIFSFAVLKVHLDKFACRIYRDTRTSSHDGGVDLSTNFGVVYQIKKLKLLTQAAATSVYTELKDNFDRERLHEGNVILVIDDISREVKQYLISMKVQSISSEDLLRLASQFEDVEDRAKVLRIVYEEYRREYSSNIRNR